MKIKKIKRKAYEWLITYDFYGETVKDKIIINGDHSITKCPTFQRKSFK
jgi:hypothetical protein